MARTSEVIGGKGRVFTDEDASHISRIEELSYDLKIREVMTTDLIVVSPKMKMQDVLELLRQGRISGAPVVWQGKLVGLISLEDLIRSMVNHELHKNVEDYMTRDVITVKSTDPVVKALEKFARTRVGRLPVLDPDGYLIGIITKGDITRGILFALHKDFQAEEIRVYRASHLFEDIVSDRTSLIMRYRIKAGDFTHGGAASANIKRALLRLGANTQIARRCGVAIYEAEMNQIIHTDQGGLIRVEIEPHRILMQAIDDGPGIPDIDQAMQPGFSTAPEFVRELGFGAGMGLVNIRRCVDKMSLTSIKGKGTRLIMKIYLQPEDSLKENNDRSLQEEDL